jgi:hypothetical protein
MSTMQKSAMQKSGERQSAKPRKAVRAQAAPSQKLPPELQSNIEQYHPSVRASLRRLVRASANVADLANVFPAALYAIATRRGPAAHRRRALQQLESGAQLRDVAKTLDLAFWLRRLPPQAFKGPLGTLPASDMFSRRIVNHLPGGDTDPAFWLAAVDFGAKAADDYFAIWLSEKRIFGEAGDPQRLLTILAAYAWYSSADQTRARNLIGVPWRPEMAFDTAVCAAKSWLNRIRLVLQVPAGTISDPWLMPGEAGDFTFVALLSDAEILAESHAMQNCADQYADRIARDKCRLYSIRRKGMRVATLEIGPHPREVNVLAITQLKSRHNLGASAEIWQAAHLWMSQQRDIKRPSMLPSPDRPLSQTTWESLMLPYRMKKRGAPWLPEIATHATFAALDQDIADLARRGGVTSWLFT